MDVRHSGLFRNMSNREIAFWVTLLFIIYITSCLTSLVFDPPCVRPYIAILIGYLLSFLLCLIFSIRVDKLEDSGNGRLD